MYSDLKVIPGMLKGESSPKVNRWAARLQEFELKIHYIPCKDNVVADFLSRQIEDDPAPDRMFFAGPVRQ